MLVPRLLALLLPEDYSILNVVSIGFEIPEVAALTTSPFSDVVDSAVHACVVMPEKSEESRFSPDVALRRYRNEIIKRNE